MKAELLGYTRLVCNWSREEREKEETRAGNFPPERKKKKKYFKTRKLFFVANVNRRKHSLLTNSNSHRSNQ